MRRFLLALGVLSCLAAAPARAEEAPADRGLDPSFRGPGAFTDASPQQRAPMLSIFINWPGWYWRWGGVPFGVGARVYFPLLHNGFVPEINDSFALEAGGDLIAIGSRPVLFGLGIPIELMWAMHLVPKFAAYVKLGAALELHFGSWAWDGAATGSFLGFGLTAALGAWYELTPSVKLRVELGYPGLKVGVGFPM